MLKEKIIKKAKELGFCQVGFTDGSPFNDYKEHLTKLTEENKYPPFVTKDISLRSDPQLVLENCQTIISVAMSYADKMKSGIQSPPNREQGYISPSAWDTDYHTLLKEGMDKLIVYINSETKSEYKFSGFVDTGYLSDREVAKRSGIGYIGRNSSLITDCSGSYVWLGHILTDLKLQPDQPLQNNCGDCNICIVSCPTKAIKCDGTIDYGKCLANVLLQKTELNDEIIEKMGNRLYGCDTCQQVCPKNKGILSSTKPSGTSLGWINLDELEELSNKEFKKKYGHTAFSWRGKGVLLRNASAIKKRKTKD